jgi:alkanesulfonate monooxygenase SsuD/methylene tetrahydromethanopterin reductase-like flavin-dependent oxidoreductase (luciferase family)
VIPEFIGMVQPRLQSETHPPDKSVVLDKAYLRAFTQAHEAGGFDRVQGVQPAGSRDLALRYGSQDAARLDPLPIISFLAGKTSHTGLGVTRSTTTTSRTISCAASPRWIISRPAEGHGMWSPQ